MRWLLYLCIENADSPAARFGAKAVATMSACAQCRPGAAPVSARSSRQQPARTRRTRQPRLAAISGGAASGGGSSGQPAVDVNKYEDFAKDAGSGATGDLLADGIKFVGTRLFGGGGSNGGDGELQALRAEVQHHRTMQFLTMAHVCTMEAKWAKEKADLEQAVRNLQEESVQVLQSQRAAAANKGNLADQAEG